MSRSLLTFSVLFVVLSAITILVFRKYLALGINHSIYYCQSLLGSSSLHIPRELNLLIVVGGLFFLAIILIKLVGMFLRLNSLREKISNEVDLPKSLELLTCQLNLTGKVKLINSKRPLAYCLGFRHPKIYVSLALLNTMSRLETKAILLHEKYHLDHHDGLTLLIGQITENLFPFFPVISDLVNNFRVKREIKADDFAIGVLGHEAPIISALRKLLSFENPSVAVLPAFTDSDTFEVRVLALAGKKSARRFNSINMFLSVLAFLTILGVVATPISAYEIHHDQTDVVVVCLNSHPRNFSTPSLQIPH